MKAADYSLCNRGKSFKILVLRLEVYVLWRLFVVQKRAFSGIYVWLFDSRDDSLLQQVALKRLCLKEVEQMHAFDALMVRCTKEVVEHLQQRLQMVFCPFV